MEKFLKLRRALKLDKVKLTYRSLIRMSLYIFGLFLLLSVLAEKFFPSQSEMHFRAMLVIDYKTAEKECVARLKGNPADAKIWRLLVKYRVNNEYRKTPDGKPRESFLTDRQFKDFLKTAENPSPSALSYLYYLYEKQKQKQLSRTGSGEIFITHSENLSIENKEELGRFYFDQRQFSESEKELRQVIAEKPDDSELRAMVLEAVRRVDLQSFLEMLEDPEWVSYADDRILRDYYLEKGSYHKMFYHLIISRYSYYTAEAIVVCILAGLGWILFLVHLGHGWFWSRKEQLMIPVAFILGYFSTHFCLGIVVIQDHLINFDGNNATKDTVFNLAYCVLGIGLREEVCKMLFFMPLLPFLMRVKENYKILVYCSLVGLGFAVEENIGYWMRDGAGSQAVMSRFLTANFIHMFLTGYICYYLTIAFKKKGKAWDDFTHALIKMIVIHGVYNFFYIDPKMVREGFYFFSLMIAIYMSMQYIRLLLYSAPPSHTYLSLTRVFTVVLCLTIGIALLSMSMEIGVKESVKVIFAGLMTNAIFAYMFYREFDEHIG